MFGPFLFSSQLTTSQGALSNFPKRSFEEHTRLSANGKYRRLQFLFTTSFFLEGFAAIKILDACSKMRALEISLPVLAYEMHMQLTRRQCLSF
ncbi:hypothetical protein NC653_027516 [Populus alba x Populus x berolinensis]|uniref:Uncharacterized protein n=1 Tax=Populus alba x Populus x berolinensis TaxID=444605 RepID=A0AAD6Q6A2_9ROSI|nr:hypothetical protein NC653_027516 [Populus alba x Populus x berolinensis]